jgi:methyltransferase
VKLFTLFLAVVILQRLAELKIARNNENWMKKRGGKEFGHKHYRLMVGIHSCFFIFYLWEVLYFRKDLSAQWPLLLTLFVVTQAGRVWALSSLGKHWNTKIIVVPNGPVIIKGPYKFLKHPNYVIVTLEFIILPLLFQAYLTTIIFSILNIWILSIRIPEEEKALSELTPYRQSFKQGRRIFSKL